MKNLVDKVITKEVAREVRHACGYRSSSWSARPWVRALATAEIYMWTAVPETEDRYTVSHMVTPWQCPCSLRSLVWTISVGPGYSVSKKKKSTRTFSLKKSFVQPDINIDSKPFVIPKYRENVKLQLIRLKLPPKKDGKNHLIIPIK